VAQLGARFHGMEEVVGSIPTRSTSFQQLTVHSQPQATFLIRFSRSLCVRSNSFDFSVLSLGVFDRAVFADANRLSAQPPRWQPCQRALIFSAYDSFTSPQQESGCPGKTSPDGILL
jgi:hypothetical protein